MSPQRLVIISNLYPLPWELGRASFNRQQFALLESEYELSILVPVSFIDWFKHIKQVKQTKHLRYVPFFFTPKVGRRFYSVSMFLSLLLHSGFWLKQRKPDVMLASWAFPDAVATSWLATLFGCRFFFKVHGSDIHLHGNVKARAKQIVSAANKAQAIISVSEELRNHMMTMGIAAKKIQVVYNGVDHVLFNHECQREISAPYLLFVGNLKQDKGVMELLKAFTALAPAFSPYVLVIAGAGVMQEQMLRYIGEQGITGRVMMLGNVAHAKLPSLMQHATLVVLPSYHEGVPNVLLESMAAGTPVVATAVGGIPEIVKPDVTGFLVTPANVLDLTAALETALGKSWDHQAIREHALQFNWQKNKSQMKQILG